MPTLSFFSLKLKRHWKERRGYEAQTLRLVEIQALLDQSELDYYTSKPDLAKIGQQLFVWLDGHGRWLSRAIDECVREGIVLAIACLKVAVQWVNKDCSF